MNTRFNIRDKQLLVERALPAAASSTVTSGGLDLGHTTSGAPIVPGVLVLSAPAVNATMAPDTRTFTYNLYSSANANLGTPTTIAAGCIVQTGAGGAGAAAATFRYKPADDSKRYYFYTVVSGASTTDASAVKAKLEWVG